MSDHVQEGLSWVSGCFATIFGSTLLVTMNDIDVASRLLLTWLTIFSIILLIGVNYKKGILGLKEIIQKLKR